MIVLRADFENYPFDWLNNYCKTLNEYFTDEQFLLVPKDMDIMVVSEKYNYNIELIQEESFQLIKKLKEEITK